MIELFNLTNLILLAVAVFILVKLWSVLGKRTGNERPRLDPYVTPGIGQPKGQEREGRAVANIIQMPRTASGIDLKTQAAREDIESRLAPIPKESRLREALEIIAHADASFKVSDFLKGASIAYEMIVTAYAKGDRDTLRGLLSREVFESFDGVIAEREDRGETTEFSFVGISSSAIVDAHLFERTAQITIRFVSELITAVRSSAGEVVEGDDKAVRDVTDIWTFSRDISSSNPNWRLVATDSPD